MNVNTRGSVMCTRCGAAGTVETDVDKAEGVATVAAWAMHFMTAHPDVQNGVSRFLVMTEANQTGGA